VSDARDRVRGAALVAASVLVALGAAGVALRAETAPREPPLALPMTLPKIAYQTSVAKAAGSRFNIKGDLTLTEQTLELVTEKETIVMRLDELHSISFGKLRGDVDTDWVVLGFGLPQPVEVEASRCTTARSRPSRSTAGRWPRRERAACRRCGSRSRRRGAVRTATGSRPRPSRE
jgi:hypothetical protein